MKVKTGKLPSMIYRLLKSHIARALLALTCCVSSNIYAQKVDGVALLVQQIGPLCRGSTTTFFNTESIDFFLNKYLIDNEKICKCAEVAIANDQRLHEFLYVEKKVLDQRLRIEGVTSYLTARGFSGVMACLAAQLDVALAKDDLFK